MKKGLLLTVLAASLFAIGLTGCTKDTGTPPVLNDAGYTYTTITNSTLKSEVVPTTTITLTTDPEDPHYVTFVAEFTDPDFDVDTIHVVSENSHTKYLTGSQKYECQINWWPKDSWTGNPGTENFEVFATDKKGNKSNVIPLTLTFVNP